MIKANWFVFRNADVDPFAFSQHWFEVHGRFAVPAPGLRSYVQHHTHAAAREAGLATTHDGCSIVAFDTIEAFLAAQASPTWQRLAQDASDGVFGGRPLFQTPLQLAIGRDRVVLDGATTPVMLKAIFLLNVPDAQRDANQLWRLRAERVAALPGVRRYVQTLPVASGVERVTHGGWDELWFDDLPSVQRASAAGEWRALRDDPAGGADGLIVARERDMMRAAA